MYEKELELAVTAAKEGARVLSAQGPVRIDSEQGKGALVRSPLEKVFAYLNDPANSDVFVEAARFQRVTQ